MPHRRNKQGEFSSEQASCRNHEPLLATWLIHQLGLRKHLPRGEHCPQELVILDNIAIDVGIEEVAKTKRDLIGSYALWKPQPFSCRLIHWFIWKWEMSSMGDCISGILALLMTLLLLVLLLGCIALHDLSAMEVLSQNYA
jgi:hypothetical protein